eukprot:4501561-Amphidinium_carterae.2
MIRKAIVRRIIWSQPVDPWLQKEEFTSTGMFCGQQTSERVAHDVTANRIAVAEMQKRAAGMMC